MVENQTSSVDEFERQIPGRRLQWLLLLSSLVTIVFLTLAAFEENLTGKWRAYQKTYRAALIERAPTPQARRAAGQMEISFKQLFLPQLNRIDRCVTCHVGIDDPTQVGPHIAQPLLAHSGTLLEQHPPEKFGCTVCHDGQGRATTTDAAHGDVPYWPEVLLRGESVYTSCSRCHYDNDLYGAGYDSYVQVGPLPPLDESELEWTVPGASGPNQRAVGRGKRLVLASGCLGCHQYRGRGGDIGPDLTYVGDKTAHDFDFKHVKGDHTVAGWLFQHFKEPNAVTPDTQMPDEKLTDQQANDLTMYMLSLQRKKMPATYTPVPPRRTGAPVPAPRLFAMFCSACHGQEGRGVHYFDETNTPVPALRYTAERLALYDPADAKVILDLLAKKTDLAALAKKPPLDPETYSEFLKQFAALQDVIRNGRKGIKKNPDSPLAPINMPAWRDTLTDEQINAILAYLISLYPWESN